MHIIEIVSTKPLTPEQARVRSLKQGVENARVALQRERDRQKQQRVQKQLQRL
jgi:hypothetical protein